MTGVLAHLTKLLLDRKRLRELEILRRPCLADCPTGKICVALTCGDQEVRHHLAPGDDLRAVAAKLAGPGRG
jgi:hypothetical protein